MGSGATFVKLFSCVSYPATDSICVGLVSDFSQSHFPAYCCLVRSFYQVLVIVQRDGVEPNSFAVKLRSHQFACLSCRSPGRRPESQGADMGLMSLNGIKLVVTRLASPARI